MGFRFANVQDIHSPNFLPGGAQYFDLPGMLAVATPASTWLAGEKDVPAIVERAYKANKSSNNIEAHTDGDNASAVEWLLKAAK